MSSDALGRLGNVLKLFCLSMKTPGEHPGNVVQELVDSVAENVEYIETPGERMAIGFKVASRRPENV